ncbi:MAG: hypothetical protein PHU51_00575, partial [Candidatus Nanoarchaeia archaeon]|nr:hypothetical protein [Candidatus Nanoarchaeia archaeon]
WSNPKFSLDKIKLSGNSYAEDWTQGYVWSTVTGFPPMFTGYSQKYSSTASLKIWNEYNDGDGSSLDADKLEAKDGSYFVYGNSIYGNFDTSYLSNSDYNNVTRTGFYIDSTTSTVQSLNSPVPEDAPGSGFSYVLNMAYVPTSYNKQIGGSLFNNNLKLRTETNNVWSPWVDLLTSNFTGDTNFTGNHIQDGNLEVTGNLSATNIITNGGYLDINSTEYIFDGYYHNKILGSSIFGSTTNVDNYFDFIIGSTGSFTILEDYGAYSDYAQISPNTITLTGSDDKNFNINKEASNFNLDLGASSLDMDYMGLEYLKLIPIVKNTKDSLNITYGIYDTRAPPATISNDIFIGDVFFNRNVTMLDSLDMTSGKITNLANGTDGQDAVTYSQLQEINSSILDGDVVGPSSAADNAITRFDGVTGKLIQDSGVYIDDSNKVGIGTAAPLNQLDVAGGAVIGSALAGVTTAPANSLMVEEDIYIKGDTNRKVFSNQYWSNEMLYNQYFYPWIAAAIVAGTSSQYTALSTANHPGVNYFRSTTGNANSGYALQTLTFGALSGGEKTTAIFYISSSFPVNTSHIIFGFMNSGVGSITITQGAYIDIVGLTDGTPTAYAKTINGAGVETINETTGSLPVSAWYRMEITVNDDASSINYLITDSPATTTYLDVDITTNIPTTFVYSKFKAYTTEAGTASSYLVYLDFMDLEIDRVLDR